MAGRYANALELSLTEHDALVTAKILKIAKSFLFILHVVVPPLDRGEQNPSSTMQRQIFLRLGIGAK